MLGCPECSDRFWHYWRCPYFLRILTEVVGHPLADCPLARLGVLSPSRASFTVPVSAFYLFNALHPLASPANPIISPDQSSGVVRAVRFQVARPTSGGDCG
eukprot:5387658-Pyramimonas_sp.AAC.1